MTDFSNYNEFLKGSIFKPSKLKTVESKKVKKGDINNSTKWTKVGNPAKNSNTLKQQRKITIDIGDSIELLYLNSNEKVTVTVFDNFVNKEVRFNDNPKSSRGTKAFVNIPDRNPNEDSISVLTELYKLIKFKKIGDIIEYKGMKIKIVSIKKKVNHK